MTASTAFVGFTGFEAIAVFAAFTRFRAFFGIVCFVGMTLEKASCGVTERPVNVRATCVEGGGDDYGGDGR